MLDWIASALALIVLILNGNKKIICWPIWLLGNVFWVSYGVTHSVWSIVLVNFAFAVVNIVGWKRWSQNETRGETSVRT